MNFVYMIKIERYYMPRKEQEIFLIQDINTALKFMKKVSKLEMIKASQYLKESLLLEKTNSYCTIRSKSESFTTDNGTTFNLNGIVRCYISLEKKTILGKEDEDKYEIAIIQKKYESKEDKFMGAILEAYNDYLDSNNY